MPEKQGPREAGRVDQAFGSKHNKKKIKRHSKQGRVLRHALTGARFTRFDAEKLGDHVLPTTVALLQRRFGLRFEREIIEMCNRAGTFHCAQYWLAGDSVDRARELLAEA